LIAISQIVVQGEENNVHLRVLACHLSQGIFKPDTIGLCAIS